MSAKWPTTGLTGHCRDCAHEQQTYDSVETPCYLCGTLVTTSRFTPKHPAPTVTPITDDELQEIATDLENEAEQLRSAWKRLQTVAGIVRGDVVDASDVRGDCTHGCACE